MNIYITTGTIEFLKRVKEKNPEEKMVLMAKADGALLFHETAGETVFKQPRRYEAIESRGELVDNGYVVMYHIPITDEGRPLFEYQLKVENWLFGNEPGLYTLRALRPLSSRAYMIITIWEKETLYEKWQKSNTPLVEKIKNGLGYSQQPSVFESSPYIQKYTIQE
ncbi:hypothetical protein [Neobacillus dielmonensis]|uniref:hypothetical protein n=1 Tax=Neobacillus dielmonensis TaxID=1347369 RepID=UPI0005A62DF3|nr:hypothetical protein [Neobacillus dielmonensis]